MIKQSDFEDVSEAEVIAPLYLWRQELSEEEIWDVLAAAAALNFAFGRHLRDDLWREQ